MAEVVILELVLDPSKLQAGAKAAGEALDGLGKKASDTEKSVKQSGNAMSSAFQASGGTMQIAQGIKSTADAFGSLNVQAGLFGASRTILELGKTAQDFRNLGQATGAAGGAFSLLTGLFKASPIGFIATAVGLAAGAMSLFSSNTNEATAAVKRQNDALDQLLARGRELDLRRGLGEADPRLTVGGTANALVDVSKRKQTEMMELREAGALFGVSDEEFRAAMRDAGRTPGNEAGMVGYGPFAPNQVYGGGQELMRQRRARDAKAQREDVTGKAYRDRVNAEGASPEDAFQFGSQNDFLKQDYRTGPSNYVEQSREDHAKVARERVEEANRAMDQLIAKGERFGATIGDAFFNVASGAQTARQAIAGLVADLARAASRQAFAGIFGQVAGGFGKTAGQSLADATPSGPITIVEG